MREFTTPSFPVYMYDGEGGYKVMTMGEVFSFPLCTINRIANGLAPPRVLWT